MSCFQRMKARQACLECACHTGARPGLYFCMSRDPAVLCIPALHPSFADVGLLGLCHQQACDVVQVPLLPIFSDVMHQPASFLSHYLPTSVDASIPRNFTRQVHHPSSSRQDLLNCCSSQQQVPVCLGGWRQSSSVQLQCQ